MCLLPYEKDPWFHKSLKNSILKRNQFYKLLKSEKGNIGKNNKLLNERREVEKNIRQAKKRVITVSLVILLETRDKCIRFQMKKCTSPKTTKVKLLELDERSMSDFPSIANAFNEFFSTVGTKLAQK